MHRQQLAIPCALHILSQRQGFSGHRGDLAVHRYIGAPRLGGLHGEPFSTVDQARLAAWCRHQLGGHGVVQLRSSGWKGSTEV